MAASAVSMKPVEVATKIVKGDVVRPCKAMQLDEAIEEAIRRNVPTLHPYQILEKATAIKRQVRHHIRKYIIESEKRYVVPRVRWSESDPERLLGRGFAPRTASVEAKVEACRLTLTETVQEALGRALSWSEFQQLCARLFERLGFRARTTVRDGGIDFVAVRMLSNMAGGRNLAKDVVLRRILLGEAKLVVVGQAKGISPTDQVSPGLIRELHGAIDLIGGHRLSLEQRSRISGILQELDATSGDPVLGVFITSGRFSKEGRMIAARSGIEIIDGEQLAQILLREGVGCIAEEGQKPQFVIEDLRAWIQSEQQ